MNPYVEDKVLQHPKRVAQWLNTGDCYPVVVEIDLTNKCNLKCPWCVGGRSDTKADLDPERAVKLFDELAVAGVRGIIFSGGGDPTCATNYVQTVEAAAARFPVGFITNGVAITEDDAPRLVRATQFLRVSLDAWDAESYRYTHGVGRFGQALRNMWRLASARAHREDCNVCAGFLVDATTVDGMVKAAEICRNAGVDFVQFRPYYHALGNALLFGKTMDNYQRARELASTTFQVYMSEQKYHVLASHDGVPDRPYGVCHGHRFASVVGADGNVYLCCHMRGKPEFSFGSIYQNSFKEIWTGAQRQEAIKNIVLDKCPPLCRCDSMNRTLWQKKHEPEKSVPFI